MENIQLKEYQEIELSKYKIQNRLLKSMAICNGVLRAAKDLCTAYKFGMIGIGSETFTNLDILELSDNDKCNMQRAIDFLQRNITIKKQ